MRNIGLVSAAVIAMAAMAGTVAASARPTQQLIDGSRLEHLMRSERVRGLVGHIQLLVERAERDGLSGEPAQQSIKRGLQAYIEGILPGLYGMETTRGDQWPTEASPAQASIDLSSARRWLVENNQLRSGSDGDLAVSALLAEREAAFRAERASGSRAGRNRLGGPLRGGGGSPTAGDAGRNVPGKEAAGQPATDAATTEVQQSQTTDDSDLDDEAGEPD